MTDSTTVPSDDDLETLRARAMDHPGRVWSDRWEQWRRAVEILYLNHAELVEHVEQPEQDEDVAKDLIRNVGPPSTDRPPYFSEFYRLLHNFVGSVKTLVDHTRNLADRYPEDSEFRTAYQARVNQIADDPLAQFVQGLRNVVLHGGLPVVISTFTWSADGGARHELAFDREALLRMSEKWKRPATEYIKSQSAEFAIRAPLDDYTSKAMALSSWFYSQFRKLHGPEIDVYDRLLDDFLTGRGTSPESLPEG